MRNFLRVLRNRDGGTRTKRARAVALLATAVAAAVGAVVLLVSWGGEPGPRPVSEDEAQRMALARFRTYEASPSEVRVRLPLGSAGSASSGTVTVRAVVDHRVHRAVGVYEAADTERTVRGLVAWDREGIAVARKPQTSGTSGRSGAPGGSHRSHGGAPDGLRGPAAGEPFGDALGSAPDGAPGRASRQPAPDVVTTAAQAARAAGALPPDEWTRRPYTTAALDQALRLVLSMAADRPDNAHLLARSHPLWLRDESLDGRGYGVFSGPRPRPAASRASASPAAGGTATGAATGRSPLTYWIDKDGRMRRVTARIAPGQEATVDLVAERVHAKVPDAPWAKAKRP